MSDAAPAGAGVGDEAMGGIDVKDDVFWEFRIPGSSSSDFGTTKYFRNANAVNALLDELTKLGDALSITCDNDSVTTDSVIASIRTHGLLKIYYQFNVLKHSRKRDRRVVYGSLTVWKRTFE